MPKKVNRWQLADISYRGPVIHCAAIKCWALVRPPNKLTNPTDKKSPMPLGTSAAMFRPTFWELFWVVWFCVWSVVISDMIILAQLIVVEHYRPLFSPHTRYGGAFANSSSCHSIFSSFLSLCLFVSSSLEHIRAPRITRDSICRPVVQASCSWAGIKFLLPSTHFYQGSPPRYSLLTPIPFLCNCTTLLMAMHELVLVLVLLPVLVLLLVHVIVLVLVLVVLVHVLADT